MRPSKRKRLPTSALDINTNITTFVDPFCVKYVYIMQSDSMMIE